MNLISTGIERGIFKDFYPNRFKHQNEQMRNQIIDKKVKATYNIEVRYKNNGRKLSDSNSETLHLKFDPNLSTDLTHTEVDIGTGESLTISLLESKQPDYGTTCLVLSIQYINAAQELFENEDYCYCPTPAGTITKRLQAYKIAFDEAVQREVAKFKAEGFQVNLRHTLDNFAGYLYHENKRRAKDDRFLSEFATKADINKILVLYSIFNEDCFWTGAASFNSTLHNCPYSNFNGTSDYRPTLLYAEQVHELERMIQLKKQTLHSDFEKYHKGYKFLYDEFKQEFLSRFN